MDRSPANDQSGYVLIELVAAFAVVALVAGLCAPALPLGSRRPNVEAVGFDIVTLLREARNLSLAHPAPQSVVYDPRVRLLRGAGRGVPISPDIAFSFTSGAGCEDVLLVFRPDGTNCGAVLRLSRGTKTVKIRVNWIDDGIDMQTRS